MAVATVEFMAANFGVFIVSPFTGVWLHPQCKGALKKVNGDFQLTNLPDGVVVMCSYSFHYDAASFAIGDKVIVMIQRYDFSKKQIYGKIVAKWRCRKQPPFHTLERGLFRFILLYIGTVTAA